MMITIAMRRTVEAAVEVRTIALNFVDVSRIRILVNIYVIYCSSSYRSYFSMFLHSGEVGDRTISAIIQGRYLPISHI